MSTAMGSIEKGSNERLISRLRQTILVVQSINRLIVRTKNRQKLLDGACEVFIRVGGASCAWMAIRDESTTLAAMARNRDGSSGERLDRLRRWDLPPCAVEAFKAQEDVIDHSKDRTCDECNFRSEPDGHTHLTARIKYGDKILGLLTIALPEELVDDALVRELLGGIADDIALALHNIARDEEHRHLEGQLQHAQKLEAIGQLAGGVAHDFNNVLTGIAGYCSLILEKLPEGSEITDDVQGIREASERAGVLTQQLLAFGRRQIIEPETLSASDITTTSRRMIERILGEDVELQWHAPEDVGHIHIDRGQMDQVLVNLTFNARDAMPEGGTLSIKFSSAKLDAERCQEYGGLNPGRYVKVSVTDTGVGMDEATAAHIFEPFFTTKGRGEGTGLGLSTVYGIIRQNRGAIALTTVRYAGSTFDLYLPAADGSERRDTAPAADDMPHGEETILLVEDDALVRRVARRILTRLGYDVLDADGAETAQKLYEERQGDIDLLITDVIMPGMNGLQLFDQLSSISPDLKVLFMSGYSDRILESRGIKEPHRHFIRKPFTPQTFASSVRASMK